MWLLSILSSTLFALPVFVTFGIYFGVDHRRILECGFHCGQAGDNNDDPYASNPGPPNVTASTYCQKSYAITPPPGRYVFNPNQWGDPNNTGSLCINFTTSGLGGPDDYAAGFAATWQYPIGNVDSPVHAFPNANLHLPDLLPVQLSNMSGLTLDVSWSYDPGDAIQDSTDFDGLAAADVNANVCVDTFLASDKSSSTSTTESTFEVMVWLGRLGAATDPLGFAEGAQDQQTINGTTFTLYYGDNSFGQRTFTWLAEQNTTEFTGDIGPLLLGLSNDTGPVSTDYLGYVAFGSETLYSNRNVTFYVPKLEMDVLLS